MDIVQSRLRSPSDVLAAVPYLLGYKPDNSIVVLGLRRKKIVFQVRTDLPPAEVAGAVALQIADVVARQNVTGAVVVGYGPHDRVWPVVDPLCPEMLRSGIAILEALRADGGLYWSYVCGSEACCPASGTHYDVTATEIAAAATFAGMHPAESRAELVARLAPPSALARVAAAQAATRAEARLFDLMASAGTTADRTSATVVGDSLGGAGAPAAPSVGTPPATSIGDAVGRSIGGGDIVGRSATGSGSIGGARGDRSGGDAMASAAVRFSEASGRDDGVDGRFRGATDAGGDEAGEIRDGRACPAGADRVGATVILRAGRDAVDAAIAAGPGRCDDDLAWLALLLTNIPVRDHAWSRIRGDAGAHVELWSDVVRRVDPALAAAPATLLAYAAWRHGEGTIASIALERALDADPGYSMAHLLAGAIAGGLAPGSWLDEGLHPENVERRHRRVTGRAVARANRRRTSTRRDLR